MNANRKPPVDPGFWKGVVVGVVILVVIAGMMWLFDKT